MRARFVAVCILAGVSQVAFGQTGPYLATVTDAGATLRAGPAQAFDVTATLNTGDALLVDHEEPNGWLAVQDSPGKMYSLSWVPMQFVNFDKSKPTPQNVVVEEDVILAPGLIGSAQPMMNFRRTKVPAGTILTIIGPKAMLDGKSWYPVLPPSGDFRYIAKQMVKYDKPANTSFTIRSGSDTQHPSAPVTPAGSTIPPQPVSVVPAIGGPPSLPTVGTPAVNGSTTPTMPSIQNPLWIQAEAAEKDGRLTDAEKLYFQLARQTNEQGGDHDIANMCYTRIHSIREKLGKVSVATTTTAPRPVLSGGNPQPKTTVSTATGGSNPRPDYVATGRLGRSALDVDGRRTYVLDGSPGVPVAYVVAGPGVDLERNLGKQVNVYGTSSTRKDLSKPLAVATSAEIAP
ncbi:MAG TPA: hypothetical protein VG097_02495 [Gemmata sp.]|nr:hypothetical protein [Gemmata sp.]